MCRNDTLQPLALLRGLAGILSFGLGGPVPSSPQESLLSCLQHGGWEIGSVDGRKALLCGSGSSLGLWRHGPWHLDWVCCEHTQTGLPLPRGISALWFLLPWLALIVISDYLVEGAGMNHKLLWWDDILLSKWIPPLLLALSPFSSDKIICLFFLRGGKTGG